MEAAGISIDSTIPIAAPGAIEQRGIEYIPLSARHGTARQLAWLWSGALLNVSYVVYGALVMSLGLTFPQAVAVILVGNLSYVLTSLASLPGPASGTTTFGASRAAFGAHGNRLVAVLNWVLQVGYEVLNLSLIVLAALVLANKAGLRSTMPLKLAVIVTAGALQGVLPLFGYAAIKRVLTALVIPFVGLFALLTILVAPRLHLSGGHPASFATLLLALALATSSAGLGWTVQASDYSRYLPPDTDRRALVWAVTLGGFVPSALLMILGAAVASTVPQASDPISGLPHAFAGWFLVPYLVFVILQLYAIDSINLYSSGVTLQAIGLRVRRWQAVIIDTLIAGAIVTGVIFSSSFYTFLSDFLLFMIVWFAPWTAIFLVDYFLRRGRYDSRALMTAAAGVYRRRGGVHVPAIVALVAGMLASASWLDTSVFKGPLSAATDGSDLSVFTGAIVAGLVYLWLAGPGVRAEAALTPDAEDIDRELSGDPIAARVKGERA